MIDVYCKCALALERRVQCDLSVGRTLSGCLFSFNHDICSVFFKDVITMYIAVQFRLMVLSFVIFLSFWLSIKIFLYLKNQEIFYSSVFKSAFKINTKGAFFAEDQCKSRLSIKYQFL